MSGQEYSEEAPGCQLRFSPPEFRISYFVFRKNGDRDADWVFAMGYRWSPGSENDDKRCKYSTLCLRDAVRSCADWLNWKCGIAVVAAREKVSVARALPDLPLIDMPPSPQAKSAIPRSAR